MAAPTRVVLIDNFDSFVYNLAQCFGSLGAEPVVVRSDRGVDALEELEPDALVVSPGPGTPSEAGMSIEAIGRWAGRVPVLGVCLGHQCVASAFGAQVWRAPVGPMHGKSSRIWHDGSGVFAGLPSPLEAIRYHSLAVSEESLPPLLRVTARADDGTVMGLTHAEVPVTGVQFHPESVLTPQGERLLANFLGEASGSASDAA